MYYDDDQWNPQLQSTPMGNWGSAVAEGRDTANNATSWVDLGNGFGAYVFEGATHDSWDPNIPPEEYGQFGGYNMPRFNPNEDDMRNPGSYQNLSNDPLGADRTADLVGAMSSYDAFAPMAIDGVTPPYMPDHLHPSVGEGKPEEQFLSGTTFDQGTEPSVGGASMWQYLSPDHPRGGVGRPWQMTASTYNPLSGFENVVEAESILPWLYAENEEDDRRINRDYMGKLFKNQAAPYNKLLPATNFFGGYYAGPNMGGGAKPFQETTGGGYDFPAGSHIPHSDYWSQIGGFKQ